MPGSICHSARAYRHHVCVSMALYGMAKDSPGDRPALVEPDTPASPAAASPAPLHAAPAEKRLPLSTMDTTSSPMPAAGSSVGC